MRRYTVSEAWSSTCKCLDATSAPSTRCERAPEQGGEGGRPCPFPSSPSPPARRGGGATRLERIHPRGRRPREAGAPPTINRLTPVSRHRSSARSPAKLTLRRRSSFGSGAFRPGSATRSIRGSLAPPGAPACSILCTTSTGARRPRRPSSRRPRPRRRRQAPPAARTPRGGAGPRRPPTTITWTLAWRSRTTTSSSSSSAALLGHLRSATWHQRQPHCLLLIVSWRRDRCPSVLQHRYHLLLTLIDRGEWGYSELRTLVISGKWVCSVGDS